MIRFEHANLAVKEIGPTLDFLLTAFPEWEVRAEGTNTWYGQDRRWVHVGDDNYYLTLNDNAEGEGRELSGHTPGLAHLGFVVDDLQSLINRMEGKNYPLDIKMGPHPYRKSVYYVAPSGIQFEFLEYASDKASEKNSYDIPYNIEYWRGREL